SRLRFTNYKAWMRSTISLWWAVIILGVGTYAVTYLTPAEVRATPPPAIPASPDAPEPVAVDVRNFLFEPRELTVPVGTTVTWSGEEHGCDDCYPDWDL